mgnify:CR=1 FL=1
MGRFQNPWIECNLTAMFKDNIQLVRRQSGGGCVYHDKENVNFSFIADKAHHNINWNHEFIVDVLKELGVNSVFSKRGDMRLDESQKRKISGSAYKEKKDTAFHHGTMLVNSDLEKLNHYIHSNKSDLESKSIQSVRSVVSNLNDAKDGMTNKMFIDTMAKKFCDIEQIEYIDENHELYKRAIDSEYLKKLKSPQWIYEETPKFIVSERTKEFEIEMTIKKSKILEIDITSDLLHPIVVANLCETLINTSLFDERADDSFIDESALIVTEWMNKYFELQSLPST